MTADRFIPYRKLDIVEMCLRKLNFVDSEASFRQFCDLLSNCLHVEYHKTVEQLKNDYAPFDPNADTKELTPFTTEQKAQCQARFASTFAQVLNAANFERITEQDLQDALSEESLFKVRLEVDFDDFEHLHC